MRNYIFKRVSAVVLLSTIAISGCKQDDYINLTPEFTLDALTNPSSIDQVEQVLNGAYANLRAANYYGSASGTGGGAALMPDILGDDLYESRQSLANSKFMSDWAYQKNTEQIMLIYTQMYKPISTANIVLRDIDKFTTTANVKRANRIKGQALALRALAHFDLFRYFADNYDRNSTTTLAVYYSKKFVVSSEEKPARMNNKEFYDNLFADLAQAETLLGDIDAVINPTSALTRPKLSLAAVHLLTARVNLYAGLYPAAITAATKGLALAPPLATSQSAFSGMYNETNAGEIIWNVQFDPGQGGPTNLVYFASQANAYYRVATEVVNTTGTTGLIRNNDVRYAAYFTAQANAQNPTSMALTKYKGKTTTSNANANFIAMKTGELYLIRAEAYAKSSPAQDALAMADLNTLRAARITGYVNESLTGATLITAIANERRRELVGEGHRFFDLKRTTRVITRSPLTCGITTISPASNCNLPTSAREWSFPYPDDVTKANTNIVQNPLWR
ncbi:RagB/SusD family nutrient uptake outer membrane protein [Pedobacter chitinilyticus]|uniref:RagB/SusD family nutrient uptake outer membrane protein n=1 Tax=Pedobacter chitinilyticus TaxID=2233776 RepID=A0A443YV91_9SPHI|nr:RagB/SusD family nutrient uptake outer membrane protein [Pedobacter chitinilyticus]RWU07732.1 RagB/SusD family nutrient uptake outer membrane protein [Pedobacter chitinilyticus]